MPNRPKALIIDGLEIPVAYSGYSIQRNKIHSVNTGRNNNGDMIGTILGIKTKIVASLIPLTPSMAQAIDDIVSDIDNMFQTVTALYVDGQTKDIRVYFGDITYNYVGTSIGADKDGLITGVQISMIEQ